MASSENGNGYWTKWLAALLYAGVTFVILTIGTSVIANDKESRLRDDDMETRIAEMCQKQSEVNQQILVSLAEIKTDLRYVKRASANDLQVR